MPINPLLQVARDRGPLRKPMLASDADLDKIQVPCMVQPKIDGVRALVQGGRLLGRSGKPFPNSQLNDMFRHFEGLDGELACGPVNQPNLCQRTTSVVMSHQHADTRLVQLWAFDLLNEDTIYLPYARRYECLSKLVRSMGNPTIGLVPSYDEYNQDNIPIMHGKAIEQGYEGLILRSPTRQHKQGRSTVNEAGLLRVKLFADAEARVVRVIEGQHNANELEETPHGYAERSTHAENMVPNGMVGALECTLLEDIFNAKGDLLFAKGASITVAAGKMSHDERVYYFQNPHAIAGKVIKFQHFPHGVKDKPRFPTFQSIRAEEDIS